MNGDQIRKCLHSGQPVYGTHVALASNSVAATMLTMAGLDFVFLCAEHMPLDRTETAAMCCMYASKGISPIVRISHPASVEVTKALDAGAQGIVAPYVETIEQVHDVVGAVHYRPIKGRLLKEFISGTRKPSAKTTEFLNRFNRHHYTIIGIESVEAIENLEELIGVDGVDGVFIGPHDVSVSMELPEEWGDPKFHEMLEQVVVRCRKLDVGVGVHMPPHIFTNDRAKRLMSLGMNWILDGADVAWAIHGMKQRREALGFGPATAPTAGDGEVASCLISEQDQPSEST